MRTRSIFTALAIPATAVGLFAQEDVIIRRDTKGAGPESGFVMAQGAVGMVGFAGEPGNFRFMTQEFSYNGKTVTNAPYSAEEKTESVQTLADQTRITNTTTTKIYRDSQGRTRREVTLPGLKGDQPHVMITITDPVAGMNYTLDSENKVAHQMPGPMMAIQMKMEAEAHMKAATELKNREPKTSASTFEYRVSRDRVASPAAKREELGGNVIEGVSVTGTRETSTIETGAMGNDRPISIVSERWYSPELQLEVKSVRNDPRMGQTTHTLTNINRTEPNPALFQVPSDYKMDEGKPGVQIRKFEVHSNN